MRYPRLTGWVLGALAFRLLVGCISEVEPPTQAATFVGPDLCASYGVTCGQVYEFSALADNPIGHVEMCVLEQDLPAAEARYGRARLSSSPRFDNGNLCIHCCGDDCPARGANAYSGTFCPGVPLSAWDIEGLTRTWWLRPAVTCVIDHEARPAGFDGRTWRCREELEQ